MLLKRLKRNAWKFRNQKNPGIFFFFITSFLNVIIGNNRIIKNWSKFIIIFSYVMHSPVLLLINNNKKEFLTIKWWKLIKYFIQWCHRFFSFLGVLGVRDVLCVRDKFIFTIVTFLITFLVLCRKIPVRKCSYLNSLKLNTINVEQSSTWCFYYNYCVLTPSITWIIQV
jgi:hypothetical protein